MKEESLAGRKGKGSRGGAARQLSQDPAQGTSIPPEKRPPELETSLRDGSAAAPVPTMPLSSRASGPPWLHLDALAGGREQGRGGTASRGSPAGEAAGGSVGGRREQARSGRGAARWRHGRRPLLLRCIAVGEGEGVMGMEGRRRRALAPPLARGWPEQRSTTAAPRPAPSLRPVGGDAGAGRTHQGEERENELEGWGGRRDKKTDKWAPQWVVAMEYQI
jgi:hypothetical protein